MPQDNVLWTLTNEAIVGGKEGKELIVSFVIVQDKHTDSGQK